MSDRLYLSLWIRGFDADRMLDYFERLLRAFPFSRLRAGIQSLRIYALEEVEPPLIEQAYAGPVEIETVVNGAREFANPDCVYIVDGWWELWDFETSQLAPSRVTFFCYGPEFENETGDHLRIELGLEAQFLPEARIPERGRMAKSNLRALLRLAADLEKILPLQQRRLWLESGENFAARVDAALLGEDAD